ncbi:MAG TPA: helix-turn-helix domain-containing protein [Planctomycetota bacterium]|nr:helix-turn-helix domain-containing protein [Planctomycetota bacterium]
MSRTITRPRRTRDAAASREAILAAAQHVFAERGFHGARVEEIARTAGVAKGTVFLHFKDKEGLLLALVRQKTETAQKHFAAMAGPGRSARERLEELVTVHRWVRDDMTEFRRKMIGMWSSLPVPLRARLEEFIRESHIVFRDRVAGMYRELLGVDELDGVKVELIAAALLACVDGLLTRCQIPAVFPSGSAVSQAVKMAFIDNLERRAIEARAKNGRKAEA